MTSKAKSRNAKPDVGRPIFVQDQKRQVLADRRTRRRRTHSANRRAAIRDARNW